MSRHKFSDETLGRALVGTPLTMDVPLGIQRRALGDVITVARESEATLKGRGRGCPLVDCWAQYEIAPGLMEDVVISAKITRESRNAPRNVILTTGTPEHIRAVMDLLAKPTGCPIWLFVAHQDKRTGRWVQALFDLSAMVRIAHAQGIEWVEATGKRGQVLTVSRKGQKAKSGKVYQYHSLRVNIKPAQAAGLFPEWAEVEHPFVPREW